MQVPMWVAKVNKRVFNPIELKRGNRPVISHTGRTSGKTYRTPLDAHPVDDGFIFVPMYGPESDWIRNVLASGQADLDMRENHYELDRPELLSRDAAWELLPADDNPPKVDSYLHMRKRA